MTIAHASTSSIGIGSTTVTPPTAAGMATGDGCIVVIATKPSTATITTPANWTLVGTNTGGAGAFAASTGPTRVGVYFREKDASWSTPPAFSVATGDSTAAASFRFTKASSASWVMDNRNGTYNGGGAALTLNVTPAAIDLMPGDYVCTALANHDDAPTWSLESYTASGFTFGALTEFADNIQTITGFDVGGAFWGAPVATGVGSVAVQQQATASANSTGPVVLIRLREQPHPPNVRVSNPALARSFSW